MMYKVKDREWHRDIPLKYYFYVLQQKFKYQKSQ